MSEGAHLIGRTLAGKFKIEAHIGSGAMGDVYRARHIVLDSVIALKIMRPDIAKDPMFRERFYREAKAASRLEHPNSVRVLDFGEEPDGLVYLAMEFLPGRDLLTLLRAEWPLTDERVGEILAQTLSAVAVAHGLGIVHRDLKPENIMISTSTDDDGHVRDHVKVCDFGIAKLNDSRAFDTENQGKVLTSTGALVGTPEYMSPEQARGDPLDARSDLYSVGIILYQLLTGRVPFTAENILGVVLKQVTDQPEPPSKHRPAVHARLEAICLRALKKNREERYQTAKEMRADLRAALGYRAPQSSEAESSPRLPVDAASQPDVHAAPTIAGDGGKTVLAPSARVDFSSKGTSDGTEITLPLTSNRRTIAGVAVAALAIGALGMILVLPSRAAKDASRGGPASGLVASGPAADPAAPVSMDPARAGTATAEPLATRAGAAAPPASPRLVLPAPRAGAVAKGGAAVSGSGALSAGAPPPPAPAASSAPSTPPLPPAPPPAPAETYNPSSAYIVLGGLTTERVREDSVRNMMRSLVPQLSECYRMALRMAGAPVPGAATIYMSIDDKGHIAPMVDAPKHPEFARCAQRTLAGQSVPASAVDSSGATASQSLKLNP